MERESLPQPACIPAEPVRGVQAELFSEELLGKSIQPVRIAVPNPNNSTRYKILVAASRQMKELIEKANQAAATNAVILLLGESGSGKNLLAWLIHQSSRRKDRPFVHFSAGLKSEHLIESELFGHEKGAFTGAYESRRGKIESAQGGTVFIDEVAELGAAGQLKFHRLLDDGTFERLGGTEERRADVRVVAATHRDIEALVREGKFREDLYHRINVVCLRVPALRERPEDIAPIAEELLTDLAQQHGKPYLRWCPQSLALIQRLPWIGNIRAMRNVIENMVVFAREQVLTPDAFPKEVVLSGEVTTSEAHTRAFLKGKDLDVKALERFHEAFRMCRGNKSALARQLSTSRTQVDRLLRRFGKPS